VSILFRQIAGRQEGGDWKKGASHDAGILPQSGYGACLRNGMPDKGKPGCVGNIRAFNLVSEAGGWLAGHLQVFSGHLAVAAFEEFELHDLTFVKGGEAGGLHGGDVHKGILATTFGLDETIALLHVEPLNGSLHLHASFKTDRRAIQVRHGTMPKASFRNLWPEVLNAPFV
jgi:hypothetical protein